MTFLKILLRLLKQLNKITLFPPPDRRGKFSVKGKIMYIYADNAATTKTSKSVVEAMMPYFYETYGNPSSLHSAGQEAKTALEKAREDIAAELGALPSEIYFTSGGSEADNQAIISAARIGERKGKKHIISSAFEHHAVLHTLDKLKKEGFEITLLPVHENGIVDVEELKAAIKEETALVTIMYVNNEIGTIQPIAEIGAVCREKGILFHTDAVQAAGHIKVDVKADNIDMLSISAHKFHGPKGIGVLYAKRGILLTNVINGGAQERGRRAGTENIPAIVGMALALKEANQDLDKKTAVILAKRDRLIEGLSKIPHSILNGDAEKRVAGTVNFIFEGIEGESLLLLLDDKGVAASSGSACTSGSLDPSHVLLAIGRPHEIAHGSLRLSFDEEMSDENIDYIIKSVTEVVDYLRKMSPVWRELVAGQREFFTL